MKHPKDPEPELSTPEDRLQHDIEELEAGGGFRSVLKWLGIVALALLVVGGIYYGTGGHKPRKPVVKGKDGRIVIETLEPARGKLPSAPLKFRWESVAGRHDYQFRVLASGEPRPLVERIVRENTTDLTPEERSSLTAGREYIWEVRARTKEGAPLGTGRGYFEL